MFFAYGRSQEDALEPVLIVDEHTSAPLREIDI